VISVGFEAITLGAGVLKLLIGMIKISEMRAEMIQKHANSRAKPNAYLLF
jgi:hypothetical protein